MFGKLQDANRHNQQGIGLGLNVCKRIVSAYGGNISLESELGLGSTFTFSFKVDDYNMVQSSESKQGTSRKESTHNNFRIGSSVGVDSQRSCGEKDRMNMLRVGTLQNVAS